MGTTAPRKAHLQCSQPLEKLQRPLSRKPPSTTLTFSCAAEGPGVAASSFFWAGAAGGFVLCLGVAGLRVRLRGLTQGQAAWFARRYGLRLEDLNQPRRRDSFGFRQTSCSPWAKTASGSEADIP